MEKPQRPRSDLALIGGVLLHRRDPRGDRVHHAHARGELEITDAIQWLVTQGADVRASEYEGYWKDTREGRGRPECNARVLDGLRPAVDGTADDTSVLVGPVVVEEGARIVRSRIEGPAIIGAGTVVEDSHISPHTSVGRGCAVVNSRLRTPSSWTGASVTGVQGLHSSLVGRSATVGITTQSTDGYRLVVGDHTLSGSRRMKILVTGGAAS